MRTRAPSIATALLVLALAAPAAAAEPYARANRLAISFGVGFGSASLSRAHDLADTVVTPEGPKGGLQLNAELGFRYYFPYYLLAEVSYGAVYNWASQDFSTGSLSTYNLAMEVPILVGGYYPLIKRLYVYGAVGPAITFYQRSWWDPGADFVAPGKVGVHALVGADFMVSDHFSVGLELRYRYIKSGDLQFKEATMRPGGPVWNAGATVTEGMLKNNGSTATYDVDLSGISLGLILRFYAL